MNFGSKLLGSIKGIFFGILLVIASFVVLFMNEGRTNYAEVAQTATTVENRSAETDFIYVTGKLDSTETLGDDLMLRDEKYLAYSRTVDMYAWVEEKEEVGENTNTYT